MLGVWDAVKHVAPRNKSSCHGLFELQTLWLTSWALLIYHDTRAVTSVRGVAIEEGLYSWLRVLAGKEFSKVV